MWPRRTPAALLLAAAALATGGCGGDADARNAYVDAVQEAQRAYVVKFDQVSKRLTPVSTLRQDRATLAAFGSATGSFVTALKGIEPPEAVRDEHGKLTEALVAYGRDVEAAGSRLASGSVADRARVRTDLSTSVAGTATRISGAVGDINARLRG